MNGRTVSANEEWHTHALNSSVNRPSYLTLRFSMTHEVFLYDISLYVLNCIVTSYLCSCDLKVKSIKYVAEVSLYVALLIQFDV